MLSRLAKEMLVPLTLVQVPPYASPRVQFSEERRERRAAPVVPVIFAFAPLSDFAVHPGQLVDVYIGER